MEPLTITAIAFVLGGIYRALKPPHPRSRDKQNKRIMPATERQWSDIYSLCGQVADAEGTDLEVVLARHGGYTVRKTGSRRTSKRKELKYVEADKLIAELMSTYDLKLTPTNTDRERFRENAANATTLEPYDDEEPF
jgi:hypothetical protein